MSRILFLLFTGLLLNFVESNRNNVCTRWRDYYYKDFSKNCYYEKDVFSNQHDILANHYKIFETHNVTTDDGYILNMFRIPVQTKTEPRGIVILQHSIASDGVSFMIQSNDSSVFLFNDQGYEVWLLNGRGTFYSRQHVNMTTDDYEYWNFSWHEQGIYDNPKCVEYISNYTGRTDIAFVGHSQGVTASIIYASLFPEHARSRVKVFIELGPAIFFHHLNIKYIAGLEPVVKIIREYFKIGSIGGPSIFLTIAYHIIIVPPLNQIVPIILAVVTGGNILHEVDASYVVVMLTTAFRAFSIKSILHYFQLINSGKVQMYDYGKKKNLQLYGSEYPTEYPLENITTPIYLISSEADKLTTAKDSQFLFSKLPEQVKKYGLLITKKVGHFGYVTNTYRREEVFDPLFRFMNNLY